jgi:hypothetical protein
MPKSKSQLFGMMTIISGLLLGGCQSIPELPTSPRSSGPKVPDLVQHIECELATIVNAKAADPKNPYNKRLQERLNSDASLSGLLQKLVDYHFVATAQLSLEVTDNEGISPSLSFINSVTLFSIGLGGQWNGTQDRSTTANYAIDLDKLAFDNYTPKKIIFDFCSPSELANLQTGHFTSGGGVAGDLGLADIVADGLTALEAASERNVYSSSGPVPLEAGSPIRYKVIFSRIDTPSNAVPLHGAPPLTVNIGESMLEGFLILAPQGLGSAAQGSASLIGEMTIPVRFSDGTAGQGTMLLNLAGGTIPSPLPGDLLYFSLTGNLLPAPGDAVAQMLFRKFGFNSGINLSGSVQISKDDIRFSAVKLEGTLGSPAGTSGPGLSAGLGNTGGPGGPQYAVKLTQVVMEPEEDALLMEQIFRGGGTTPRPGAVAPQAGAPQAGAQTPQQAGKGGGNLGAAAGGATAFGSLVDFVLIYGLNGGPNWTYQTFKGPAGAGTPLVSGTRTKTDSLSISFVAACQDFKRIPFKIKPSNYWESIGPCDNFGNAQMLSQNLGFQNNSLMLLRNAFLRP